MERVVAYFRLGQTKVLHEKVFPEHIEDYFSADLLLFTDSGRGNFNQPIAGTKSGILIFKTYSNEKESNHINGVPVYSHSVFLV
jgi:hypothetical protein